MICKDWLIDDLKHLTDDYSSIENMKYELSSLDLELSTVKAISYETMPTGGVSMHSQEERWLDVIAKKEAIESCLTATQSHVKTIENLLMQLSDEELEIVRKMIISPQRNAAETLAAELGFERRQIFNKRDAIINRLLRLRYGVVYHP